MAIRGISFPELIGRKAGPAGGDRYLDVWLGPKPLAIPKADKDPALVRDAERLFRKLVVN